MAFSSQGDRIALTQIEQMTNGSYVKLGYYNTEADNLTWFDREKWAGKARTSGAPYRGRGFRSKFVKIFLLI